MGLLTVFPFHCRFHVDLGPGVAVAVASVDSRPSLSIAALTGSFYR